MITLVTLLVLGRIACVVSRLLLQRETTLIKVLYIILYLSLYFILFFFFFFWLFKLNQNICLVCVHFKYLLKIFVEAA